MDGDWQPNEPRFGHTATLLPNGQVLVADVIIDGDTEEATNSAELYDPKTGSWSFTGYMKWPRYYHTAVLLPNKSVLVGGGGGGGLGFEIYDGTTKNASSI